MTLVPYQVASAAPNRKVDFLLHFFDMNEMAFAYHRHCLSPEQGINEVFLTTLNYVANELFAEAQRDQPNTDPKYIQTKILERRYNLQYRLDNQSIKNGCNTAQTEMAKAHYEEFSHYSVREVQKFIDENTNHQE